MNQKHTPGPWEWDSTVWNYDPQNDAPWLIQSGGSLRTVLTGEIKCNEADAYLIAAAPDLLAVAQKIKAHGTLSSTWYDELEAAINKATGAQS